MIGCFSPSVPSGGYLCSATDQACPSGQHCTCGLCVKSDAEAACKFVVDTGSASELEIHEHEKFSVSLSALTMNDAPATNFRGTVNLAFELPDGSKWGDVQPAKVEFSAGKASLMVSVNRESIPPQKPALVAHFAGGVGSSVPLHVSPQPLARDSAEVAKAPWGWADLAVGFPSVKWDGKQFRMYFIGAGGRMQKGFGVATSSDGKSFTPSTSALLGDANFAPTILSAFPYQTDDGWRVAMYGVNNMSYDIYAASSSDGLTPFSVLSGGAPVVSRTSCAYCDFLVWFPSVLRQDKEYLMFFGAGHCNKPMGCNGVNDGVSMAIGRARSTDGEHFSTEPAPVLSGDMGGETYLAAPQVVKDGSIYKMWYAFTRDVVLNDPCLAQIRVGYATSADGFYWVRSPSNPVLQLDGTGWEGNTRAMLPGSVVPKNGTDFESGLILYYSPLVTILVPPYCIPSGIGRAQNR